MQTTEAVSARNISVIVPVFRNSGSLSELTRRIESALTLQKNIYHEILLVDDASDDSSWRVIEEITRSHATVRGFRLAENRGQHVAVLFGLSRAQHDIFIVLDADLQDPPEAIPLLLETLWTSKADVVFAGRSGFYQPWVRMLTSRIYRTLLLKGIVGLPNGAGMFFGITRSGLERVFNSKLSGKPMVIGLIAAAGLFCINVPVKRASRAQGQSAYTSRQRLRSAFSMLCCALLANRGKGTPVIETVSLVEIADSVNGGCQAQ